MRTTTDYDVGFKGRSFVDHTDWGNFLSTFIYIFPSIVSWLPISYYVKLLGQTSHYSNLEIVDLLCTARTDQCRFFEINSWTRQTTHADSTALKKSLWFYTNIHNCTGAKWPAPFIRQPWSRKTGSIIASRGPAREWSTNNHLGRIDRFTWRRAIPIIQHQTNQIIQNNPRLIAGWTLFPFNCAGFAHLCAQQVEDYIGKVYALFVRQYFSFQVQFA